MKIIDKKLQTLRVVSLVVFLLSPRFLLPETKTPATIDKYHFSLGAAFGYFYPQQGIFRKNYHKSIWPVELQLAWNANQRISFFAGGRFQEASGNTVSLALQQPEETYALRLQIFTMRLGINYRFWPARFTPFLGSGVSSSSYKEKWLAAPLLRKGNKIGFFVQAGGRYRLSRRWHILGQLEYSFVPAGSGVRGKVNLGGLNLSLGLLAGIL